MSPTTTLTTRCLQLAEQLLTEAHTRPSHQTRLTSAASVARRIAELALDEHAAASGYLDQAVDLLEPALTSSVPAAQVRGADVYADMARTYAAQIRKQREQGVVAGVSS